MKPRTKAIVFGCLSVFTIGVAALNDWPVFLTIGGVAWAVLAAIYATKTAGEQS